VYKAVQSGSELGPLAGIREHWVPYEAVNSTRCATVWFWKVLFTELASTFTLKLNLSHYTPKGTWGGEEVLLLLFLDFGTMWGEWSASRPGCALSPGTEPPLPTIQETGWVPETVWTQRLEKTSFHLCRGSSLIHPFVQPVVRHYTDWATRLRHLP
jgi:hypothetical protein